MLKDLAFRTRSHRSFNEERRISEEELRSIVDVTRYCPYAMNLQPLKFKLVHKKEDLDKMLSITSWGGALPNIKLPPERHAPMGYVIICHDTTIAEEKPIFLIDVGIVSEAMVLFAAEMGISACILGSAKENAIREKFALPSFLVPKLVIAFGEGEDDVRIIDAEDGSVKYFRNETNTHFVPKRKLEDIII